MSVFRRISVGEFIYESAQDAIVAAGTTQANAFQLGNVEMNRLTTVAAGAGVLLPPAQPGLGIIIVNHGANAVQVYGQPGDTINDVATATGVPQMANSWVFYGCFTAGAWYTEGLATGFAAGFTTFSSTDNITAHATTAQATATLLVSMYNRVVTVASATDAVRLPPAVAGMEITVTNAHASNAIDVYPSSAAQGGVGGGDKINAIAQNSPYQLVVAAKTCTFFCSVAGQWHTALGA